MRDRADIIRQNLEFFGILVREEMRIRYSGSFLGGAWGILSPLATILVFWYVFEKGFRNPPIRSLPFIIWFAGGYVPWSCIQDALLSSCGAFRDYAWLVQKQSFPYVLLPAVKAAASICTHLILAVLLWGAAALAGYRIYIRPELMLVALADLCVFLTSAAYVLSTVQVFAVDLRAFIGAVLPLVFWMTPIAWDQEQISGITASWMLTVNPFTYLVAAFRQAIGSEAEYCGLAEVLFFWGECLLLILLGMYLFRRLGHRFADVL